MDNNEIEKKTFQVNMTPAEFDKLYEQKLATSPTYKAAYHETEKIHEQVTGHRKYADSESYRVSRNKRLKKKVTMLRN